MWVYFASRDANMVELVVGDLTCTVGHRVWESKPKRAVD